MSSTEKILSADHLLGNTEVLVSSYPTLRGSIRRADPDFVSPTPYVASLTGKTLRIEYTKEVATVVTTFTVNVAFVSDDYNTAIAAINAIDTAHVRALDADGFLVVRNLNPGRTHYIKIMPFATPADDAAPYFGLERNPLPGSVSYAGEISSTSGIRTQSNPQGTALVGKNEDLASSSINRGLAQILHKVEQLKWDLEREVLVYVKLDAGVAIDHPISGTRGVYIDTPALRFPNDGGLSIMATYPPSAASDLDPLITVVDADGNLLYSAAGEPVRAMGLFYADNTTALNLGALYSVWGTPDGGTIFGAGAATKSKHASTVITSIKGNILHCTGATFVSSFVQTGDPIQITGATNLIPFDHNGWFVVDEVFGEEDLSVRPLSAVAGEAPPTGSTLRPRGLNRASGTYGSAEVFMGSFIPLSNMFVTLNDPTITNVYLRIALTVPLRKIQSFATLIDRAARDSKQAITINYAGGPAWLHGLANPATTVEDQFDKIITDLIDATGATADGASRIGAAAVGDLSAGSIRSALNQLDTEWGRLARANTWSATQTVNGGALDDDPVFITSSMTNKKLIWQSGTDAAGRRTRLYFSRDLNTVGLEITVNAVWDGAVNWTKDVNGLLASRQTLLGTGAFFQSQIAGVNSWLDSSWTRIVMGMGLGDGVAETTPAMYFGDKANNYRFMVDRSGFPIGGQISEIRAEWESNPALPQGWSRSALAGTPTSGFLTPSTTRGYTSRTKATDAAGEIDVDFSAVSIPVFPNHTIVMEFLIDMELDITSVGDTELKVLVGLCDSTSPFADPSGQTIGLAYDGTNSADWRLYVRKTGAGLVTNAPTGIVPVDNTPVAVKLEIHGSATAYGASTVLLFLDGVLAATVTTNIPAAAMALEFYIENEGVSSHIVRLSPWKTVWNRVLTPPLV